MSAPAPCHGVGREEESRPTVHMALMRHAESYLARHAPGPRRLQVLNRILACRTAAMGTHLFACEDCGATVPLYGSCGDRHCPQCQGQATADWLAACSARMLPVPHYQVVFTLPAALRTIAFDNQALVYGLLFRVGASILQDLAAQRMQARLGVLAVLHTWANDLRYHPHLHCLVTAGGLHLDEHRWVPTRARWLFPMKLMGTMFRGRFLEALIDAFERKELTLRGDPDRAAAAFGATVRDLAERHARWVVWVEAPRGRPVQHAVRYLARYVKRVAISDARIRAVSDQSVTLGVRKGSLTLDGAEFVHRFLLHVLPRQLRKVRHSGLYAPGNASLQREEARGLLAPRQAALRDQDVVADDQGGGDAADPPRRGHGRCPACGSDRLRWVAFLAPGSSCAARAPP